MSLNVRTLYIPRVDGTTKCMDVHLDAASNVLLLYDTKQRHVLVHTSPPSSSCPCHASLLDPHIPMARGPLQISHYTK